MKAAAAFVSFFTVGGFAFIVPVNLSDGIYSIKYDPVTGQSYNKPTLVGSIVIHRDNPELSPRQRSPPPLDSPRLSCGSNDLQLDDFNTAKDQFEGICDNDKQYPPHEAIVIAYQSAVAYMCNFGAGNRCWRQEYEEASQIMDRQCGDGKVATVYVDRWKKTYGRDLAGSDICR